MSDWLDLSDNANCFRQTYVQGFVDVSGGSIITRGTGGGLVIGGDSSLNGTVYLGDSIFVRSDGMVAPGTADNGATPFYVDASYADVSGGAFIGDVVSYDISGNAENGAAVSGVYFPADASWSQLGFDIDGEAASDYSGHSVSMINSATYGRVVAIGAIWNESSRGHVRVYQYKQFTEDMSGNYHYTSRAQDTSTQTNPLIITEDTTTAPVVENYYWTQLGADIDGEANDDWSGYSVSLVDSANGLVVAIGARANGGTTGNIYDYRGHVRVYQYDANKTTAQTTQTDPNYGPIGWNRLGADIDGEAASDYSGHSVSLVDSANGLVVAIGAFSNDGTTGSNSDNRGHVRVYQYDADKTSEETSQSSPDYGPIGWRRLGADIDGEAAGDYSGHSVSMINSATYGLVVAIGAYRNDGTNTDNVYNNRGHVCVYQYDANKTTAQTDQSLANFGPIGWRRLGADIDGEAAGDGSGYSVSLVDSSNNGLVVAIGAYWNDGTAYSTNTSDNRGHVRVYQYDASKNNLITEESSTDYGPIGWKRLGADIDGEAAGDNSGYSVSLVDSSNNGLVVAIGAPYNDGTTGSASDDRGHVRVYQYKQFTEDMSGNYHYTSRVQDISTQTNPLIITEDTTTAPVVENYYWTQLGADIDGEANDDLSGYSVSLVDSSNNGLVVAIGAYWNDGNGSKAGHVRVYEIPYTNTYSDIIGGFFDVQVIGGYNNDGLTSAALYVNGDTDISGGLTVGGDVSFNAGNLFVAGDLSLNGNLFINSFAPNSIGADAIDSTVDINFANKLSVSNTDLSFSTTGLQVATDFNSDNTPINLATNLTVPANIAIVDGSNGTVYGSYLTLTNKDATAYYNVGKSASGIFNIVNQTNAGVYLASGGTSFTGTSDARLKTNVVPLESATDKIMALNPCTYLWNSEVESAAADNTSTNTKPHVGFIAQEVEKIMPELVHPIDHPAGPDYKGVNTTDMIPYLVRTIQEQTQRITRLQEKLAAIKNQQ